MVDIILGIPRSRHNDRQLLSCTAVVFVFGKITNSDLATLNLLRPQSRDVSDDSLSGIMDLQVGVLGFIGLCRRLSPTHHPQAEQFPQTQLWLRKRPY